VPKTVLFIFYFGCRLKFCKSVPTFDGGFSYSHGQNNYKICFLYKKVSILALSQNRILQSKLFAFRVKGGALELLYCLLAQSNEKNNN
jgi:hypothetical protein